jgi:hypothetical protein
MATMFLFDGPEKPKHTVLLAHGAGGPMDSPGDHGRRERSREIWLPRRPLRIRLHSQSANIYWPKAAATRRETRT